jgi:hypothetical protein
MQKMTLTLRLLTTWAAAAAVALVALLAGGADSVHATSFTPELSAAVTDPTPGAPSDVVSHFNLKEGDVNFAAVVSFIPPEWGVVRGDKIPVGMKTGELHADSVLGLFNGACNQQLPVAFDMLNASLNLNDTVSFNDDDKNNTADFADFDASGQFRGISQYPDFLTRVFKDKDGKPMQPIRRSAGITPVAGTPVFLEFLIFPPGTEIPTRGQGTLPSDKKLGYPSVTVLQNIGDPDAKPQPGVITDFCTPLTTTNTVFGVEHDSATDQPKADGMKFFVNPQDSKYTWTTAAFGQRDADGDSYENSLDTCPTTPNVGNPRITGDGDDDSDGLDAACDPDGSVATGTNSDQDADGYLNRNDNCPLQANGENDSENQKDTDLDQIGDICDKNPNSPDGELSQLTPTAETVIGTGSGTAAGPTKDQCPTCYNNDDSPISTGGASQSSSSPQAGTPTPSTHASTPTASGGGDSGSSSSGTTIAIIAGIIAAIVIIGGGAALVMRRRGGA